MIARGFKSVGWVAAVGAAALGCYMLSLQVATERADLAKVERQIISTKQQIRSLQTELGTRGRLTQLEQWNNDVLALAAPASGQFLQDEFTLARLETHDATVGDNAPVRMAALETDQAASTAPAVAAKPVPAIAAPDAQAPAIRPDLVHRASFTTPPPAAAASTTAEKPARTAVLPDPAKPAKAKATVPARAIATASADSRSPSADKPAAASTPARDPAGRPKARTEVARAVSTPTAPARVATTRAAERGSAARAETGAPARSTVSRTAADRPTPGRAAGGATAGKK